MCIIFPFARNYEYSFSNFFFSYHGFKINLSFLFWMKSHLLNYSWSGIHFITFNSNFFIPFFNSFSSIFLKSTPQSLLQLPPCGCITYLYWFASVLSPCFFAHKLHSMRSFCNPLQMLLSWLHEFYLRSLSPTFLSHSSSFPIHH